MKKKLTILYLMTTLLTMGCSDDNTAEQEPVGEYEAPVSMVSMTRATLGSDITGDIRVFLSADATVTEGLFKKDGSTLVTRLKLKSGTQTYRLYGYMPDDETLDCSLTSVTADAAVMRIQGLQPATAKDYCVVTGVRQAENAEDEGDAVRGNFAFEYRSSRHNYINLLLDHLQSRLVFSMRVGPDYNVVRDIKVKRMQLKTVGASNLTASVTLTNGTGISDIDYTVTGTAEQLLTIRDDNPQKLTTTSTPLCSAYVIPDATLLGKLQLVTEYDVYDKQGNKIAERTVTNKLAGLVNELQRGEDRTLWITVEPSYLQVLSERDLNDPSFVIE